MFVPATFGAGAGIFILSRRPLLHVWSMIGRVAGNRGVTRIGAFSETLKKGGCVRMSEYIKTETCFVEKHLPELVKALEGLFGEGSVEVHSTPQRMYGYAGDLRETAAHVIVRRRHVNAYRGGSSSNDIGFMIEATGKLDIQLSKFDRNVLPDASFMVPLKREYNKLVVQKILKGGGFVGIKTDVQQNGRVVIRAARL